MFEFFGVYGPADHSRSASFLEELEREVKACRVPVLISGDFNLIRGPKDKNNANINWPRVHLFNEWIAGLALQEIECSGANFTWSNKQRNPIRCVLDRVFVSATWDAIFPLSTLRAETILGCSAPTPEL